MNKRGAEKILSVYWFAILIIIAGAVVAMVALFYGSPYDVREIEANIMINKVSDCLSDAGKLNENLFNESSGNFIEEFSLLEECNLTFKTEKVLGDKEQYYLEINFYNLSNGEKVFDAFEGDGAITADCEIRKGEKEYKRLAKCVNRSFYSVNSEDVYEINVLSGIRKTQKNVK